MAADTPPAGQSATGAEGELREAIARWLYERELRRDNLLGLPGTEWERISTTREARLQEADALLAGPLASLVADRETVRRVRELADHWDTDEDARYSSARIARQTAARAVRRALGDER